MARMSRASSVATDRAPWCEWSTRPRVTTTSDTSMMRGNIRQLRSRPSNLQPDQTTMTVLPHMRAWCSASRTRGGQQHELQHVTQPILARLLELDAYASLLADEADDAEQKVEHARAILNGQIEDRRVD